MANQIMDANTHLPIEDLSNVPVGTNVWFPDGYTIDGKNDFANDYTLWREGCFTFADADGNPVEINCSTTTEVEETIVAPVTPVEPAQTEQTGKESVETTTVQAAEPEQLEAVQIVDTSSTNTVPQLAETGVATWMSPLIGAAIVFTAIKSRLTA